ncbi:MAG: hypothetical protein RL885_19250 [Planctomycetota bacterium]
MIRNAAMILSVFLLLASVSSTPAHAQLCFGPDNLAGPCCTQTALNIPTPLFAPVSLPGIGICWSACNPVVTQTDLKFGAFNQNTCGNFTASLSVNDTSGNTLMTGNLDLEYSRTWAETNFNAEVLQVWRFLAKIDLVAVPGATCPAPATGEPSSFFYGYFDMVLNCFNGTAEWAVCLFHPCDKFIHNPLASAVPGAYHPQESYAIVAPVTAANPFLPVPLPPFNGPATGGGVHQSNVPGTILCSTEEPIPPAGGQLSQIIQACACPINLGGPLQYTLQTLSLGTTCGTTSAAFWTPNPLPWIYTVTTSLGTWTGTGANTPYPGPEAAWVTEGFHFTVDGCTSIPFIEVYYGAMTDVGFPVTPDLIRSWQTGRKLDIGSNYSRSSGINPPFVGLVRSTRRVACLDF